MTRGIQVPLPAPPPGRSVPRKRERKAIENESRFQVDSIASFKISPTILPKDIQTFRPLTGLCCKCLPMNQKNESSALTSDNGICNILNVKPHLRNSSWIHKQFPELAFTLQRRSFNRFPNVSLAVFTSNRLLEAIQKTSIMSFSRNFQDDGRDIQTLQTSIILNAKKMMNKMKASISTSLIRFTGWFLLKFLSIFLRSILVHRGQMKMICTAAEKKIPMIYLPLHRSHLDYILITFVLWNYEIRAPYVAAGDNLDIPFFNKLMQGLGGFFIRRRLDQKAGEKDIIYRTLLHTYLEELLKQGEGMEFFIEGGRSRSGKSCLPKGGLLSIITEACSNGQIPDAYIVPVSISYDKLIDGNFTREQMGLPKTSESFWRAWKAILNVIMGDYGSVRMDFAQPFSLKEFIECYKRTGMLVTSTSVDSAPDTPPTMDASYPCLRHSPCSTSDLNRHMVDSLAYHVVHTASRTTSLMSTHLVAFVLLTKFRNGARISVLSVTMERVVNQIRERGRDIGFSGKMTDAAHNAMALLGTNLIQMKVNDQCEGDLFVRPNLKLPNVYELMYYSNTVLSVYLLESVVAISVVYVTKNNSSATNSIIEVTKEQILTTAEEICKILEQEFIFVPPCKDLRHELAEILDTFITKQILYQEEASTEILDQQEKRWSENISAALSWADEDEDDDDDDYYLPVVQKYKVNVEQQENREWLGFLLSVLAPTFEAYHTTAHFIDVSLKTEMAEDDFIRQLNHFSKSQSAESKLRYNESTAIDTLKICVKSFHKLDVLASYSAGNLRMVGLNENFDIKDKLIHFIRLLEATELLDNNLVT